jgi:hypothetical protein
VAAATLTLSVITLPDNLTGYSNPDYIARNLICGTLLRLAAAVNSGVQTSGNVTLDPNGPGAAATIVGTWAYVKPA